jgi:hypothetical protein
MPKRGAQNDVCSLDDFLGIVGLITITQPTTLVFSLGVTMPNDGQLLASRLSYNWVVTGCRRA